MKLEQYLQREGLTPSAFADRLGRSRSTISRLLRGERNGSKELADQILSATGGLVTIADLWGHPTSSAVNANPDACVATCQA